MRLLILIELELCWGRFVVPINDPPLSITENATNGPHDLRDFHHDRGLRVEVSLAIHDNVISSILIAFSRARLDVSKEEECWVFESEGRVRVNVDAKYVKDLTIKGPFDKGEICVLIVCILVDPESELNRGFLA